MAVEISGFNTVSGWQSHTQYELKCQWYGVQVLPESLIKVKQDDLPEKRDGEMLPLKTWSVERRFKEFASLHKKLSKRMRLPPLPAKSILRKMDKDFVAQRRVALELFLVDVMKIPQVFNSKHFANFMDIDISLIQRFYEAQGLTERKKPVKEAGTGSKIVQMSVNDFELLRVVGKGTFGKVMQVRKKDTGEIYAMKVLNKETVVAKRQERNTQTERKVLEMVDHPFIVCLRFAFQSSDKLYMVTDYFEGGELFFHLNKGGKFTEETARFFAAELTLALECLHQNGIIYRDLKPENVLLDVDGHVRLTDFGLAKETAVSGDQVTHTFCGTPHYLAPEVINRKGYSKEVDWWSLGTLLYEMLTGLPPFYHTNVKKMYESICFAELTFPKFVQGDSRDILCKFLDRNPARRLGSGPEGSKNIKEHPFFSGLDWDALLAQEVTPPYKPEVTDGKMDTSNVAKVFRNMKVEDSPPRDSHLQTHFTDFSFDPNATHPEIDALGDKADAFSEPAVSASATAEEAKRNTDDPSANPT